MRKNEIIEVLMNEIEMLQRAIDRRDFDEVGTSINSLRAMVKHLINNGLEENG